MKESPQNRLKKITSSILEESSSYLDIRNACSSLSELFFEISAFTDYLEENNEPVYSDKGKAIPASMAAMCIMDIMRTTTFVRGINQAIKDILEKKQGQPVRILYAGTGPFATLITPLISCYSPEQMQVMMLEINKASLTSLRKLISNLHMEPYVVDIVQCDASEFSIPTDLEPDIILCEALNAALQKEPQLEIVANLVSQCKTEAVLIPEKIKVGVGLTGYDGIQSLDPFELGTLLELTSDMAKIIQRTPDQVPVLNQGVEIKVPPFYDSRLNQLSLLTSIRVYKNHEICFNETGLTIPVIQMTITAGQNVPPGLLYFYDRGRIPGFRYEPLEKVT